MSIDRRKEGRLLRFEMARRFKMRCSECVIKRACHQIMFWISNFGECFLGDFLE